MIPIPLDAGLPFDQFSTLANDDEGAARAKLVKYGSGLTDDMSKSANRSLTVGIFVGTGE